jgi:hypothetical protein
MSAGSLAAKAALVLVAVALIGKYTDDTHATPTPSPPSAAGVSAEPGTSAQVQQWISQADQLLTANGTPAADLNDGDVALIIRHESGGNPGSVNRTDANAARGNPSKGLMQTTGTTFAAHCLPGHCGDITNPVDNIVAGVRYALGRYGSLDNVPGVIAVRAGRRYVGY